MVKEALVRAVSGAQVPVHDHWLVDSLARPSCYPGKAPKSIEHRIYVEQPSPFGPLKLAGLNAAYSAMSWHKAVPTLFEESLLITVGGRVANTRYIRGVEPPWALAREACVS